MFTVAVTMVLPGLRGKGLEKAYTLRVAKELEKYLEERYYCFDEYPDKKSVKFMRYMQYRFKTMTA